MTFKKLFKLVILAVMFAAVHIHAEEVSREQIKSLDEQVQDIKKDVLGISSELLQLEEKLLYPSNTQVSIFVSFAKDSKFKLDAVNLKLDGKDVMHHLYTLKELEALQSGGVQRLYTGNIKSGSHLLEVSTKVRLSSSNSEQKLASYKFDKAVEPKLVEIHLSGSGSSNDNIEFRE